MSVEHDFLGVNSVNGSLVIPGVSGGDAKVTISAQRLLFLPIYLGQMSVVDANSNVSVEIPLITGIAPGANNSVHAESSWFLLGTWPDLLKPISITWTVQDVD